MKNNFLLLKHCSFLTFLLSLIHSRLTYTKTHTLWQMHMFTHASSFVLTTCGERPQKTAPCQLHFSFNFLQATDCIANR